MRRRRPSRSDDRAAIIARRSGSADRRRDHEPDHPIDRNRRYKPPHRSDYQHRPSARQIWLFSSIRSPPTDSSSRHATRDCCANGRLLADDTHRVPARGADTDDTARGLVGRRLYSPRHRGTRTIELAAEESSARWLVARALGHECTRHREPSQTIHSRDAERAPKVPVLRRGCASKERRQRTLGTVRWSVGLCNKMRNPRAAGKSASRPGYS
jgi:hypothetical protein